MRRPPLTLENAEAIREQVSTVDLVGSELWDFGYTVEYKGESTNPNVSICGGTPEYPHNNTHYVGLGRNLSQMDVQAGRNVAVIGHAIAQKLFPFVGSDRQGHSGSTGASTRWWACSTRRSRRSGRASTTTC